MKGRQRDGPLVHESWGIKEGRKWISKQTPDACASREVDGVIGLRVSAIHRREKGPGQCLGRGGW